MSASKCILCFKDMEKDYEKFLVKSEKTTTFDVSINFPNWISTSTLSLSTFVDSSMLNIVDLFTAESRGSFFKT